MNRLTRKHKHTNYIQYTDKTICLNNYNIRNANVNKAIEKLGKLEDIEEELGCPLEAFVGIMLGKITEIVVNYGDAGGYEPLYEELTIANVSGIIESYEHPSRLCLETNLCDVPINDYGKNWWLKGERDE